MTPLLFGILNMTEDSFSDGGRFLDPGLVLAHARALAAGGADVVDIGAAASNPNALPVPAEVEIARMAPVVDALTQDGIAVSIDTFAPETQAWAAHRRVAYINDIHGFPDAGLYPALAAGGSTLIVMHAVQDRGRATRVDTDPATIMDRILAFFDRRIAELEKGGIARSRIVLDPGMGQFVGSDPEVSLTVLRDLPRLRAAFGLPILVSVSRKGFLRKLTGKPVAAIGPATLAAELFAAGQGADAIRTHDPAALRDCLTLWRLLSGISAQGGG